MTGIYLDHAATTPVDQQVAGVMTDVSTNVFGNPSSIHAFGRQARQYLDEARRTMAESIQANEKEIIFTSGGTEADNLALIGTAMANRDKGRHIITTNQEHHAVLDTADALSDRGFDVTYLPVDHTGVVNVDDVREALTDETILVSVMYVNNETGMIQPVQAIGNMLKNHQAYFHTDAVQALGLLDIDVKNEGIDLLTATAHKLNGPKGVGCLYASNDVTVDALQFGGEQERTRRPGTENIPGIAGFQKAVELAMANKDDKRQAFSRLKDQFLKQLDQNGITYEVNGSPEQGIASIINLSFPGTSVEPLLTNFDLDGIAASSGSACTAGSVEPSHVLSAMYDDHDERVTNSIRFSFGTLNTIDNVAEAANRVANIVNRLKN